MALPNPITRKEQYLAKAAGESVSIPEEPHTREEMYLEKIAEGGGGGGGTTVIANPSEEATDDLTKLQIGDKVYGIEGGNTCIKYKKYTGAGGSETVIELDDSPLNIVGILELGTHSGYWGVLIGFAAGSCKGLWVTPNNNAINGVNLSYSVSGSVLTITGGAEATQRADALGTEYIVLYV